MFRAIRRPFLPLAAAFVFVVGACGIGDDVAPSSFDPAQPCAGAARQMMKGAYPDLEARIPATIAGREASSRDSGRFCAKETLGALWDAGVTESQFGGAIFRIGEKGALQATVFRAQGLTASLLAEEYRTGATADRRVQVVSATTETFGGREGYRLNLLNGDSRQALIVWPAADGAVILVVIAADVDESVVQEAIASLR